MDDDNDETPTGISNRRFRIHYRDGRTQETWVTMAALSYAERQGISPLQRNSFSLATAWRCLDLEGHPVGPDFDTWAQDADPVLIEEFDAPPDPTSGRPLA